MQVFITGVSSGIGKDLVKLLVRQGHEVRGIARSVDRLQSLADEVGQAGFRYDVCDISDPSASNTLQEKMSQEGYVPDIVVLNAAIDLEDELPGLDADLSRQIMRTNYDGAHYWIAAFIEPFLHRGSGQFIAISSLFAQWPDNASVSYSASKAALSMLMRGLRMRYANKAIDFKILYLGPVDTPINPRFSEGQSSQSLVVASSPKTAEYIVRMISSKRQSFYYPTYILLIFTFLRWLPDKIFELVTSPFKR
ncbi:MAG: short-subunit dehydrogenase [Halioglobus sp.]|jgi:short-subunit dehydrogenase